MSQTQLVNIVQVIPVVRQKPSPARKTTSYTCAAKKHVDLDTNHGVYLRHDAFNDRHLENLNARLWDAEVSSQQ